MKFQQCFIDHHGNIWKTETLKRAVKGLPVFQFNLSKISLDEKIRWSLVDVRDYLSHYSRTSSVNLNTPIILRPDGYVMDGWHRIIKALCLELKTLPAQQLPKLPVPDFISKR